MAQILTPAMLAAQLRAAAVRTPPKVIAALNKAGFDTQRDARTMAPVDTGHLRGSITIDPATVANPTVEVGPEANYGHYLEHGTVNMGPQPYMNPAADRHIPALEEAMRQIDPLS